MTTKQFGPKERRPTLSRIIRETDNEGDIIVFQVSFLWSKLYLKYVYIMQSFTAPNSQPLKIKYNSSFPLS